MTNKHSFDTPQDAVPTVEAGPAAPEPLVGPIGQHVQMIFPTPLAVHRWPDSEVLNRELFDLVMAAEVNGGGTGRSNVGGWHSASDFILRREPCLERLVMRVRVMVGEMVRAMMKPRTDKMHIEGWANVLRHGQYNMPHVHPNATWSGVYYVTGNPAPESGDHPHSGKIEFTDPRPGAAATYTVENMMQQSCMLNPDAGTMVVFPSWLVHQVHPYFGPDARVSIAFNVVIS